MGERDGGRGGSLKTGVEAGIWGGGGEGEVGEGIGILLVWDLGRLVECVTLHLFLVIRKGAFFFLIV